MEALASAEKRYRDKNSSEIEGKGRDLLSLSTVEDELDSDQEKAFRNMRGRLIPPSWLHLPPRGLAFDSTSAQGVRIAVQVRSTLFLNFAFVQRGD